MKALLCREFGPEANMNVEEIDAPELKPGHVLVDVNSLRHHVEASAL